jgi:Asp/Glu/hydantoin racemase
MVVRYSFINNYKDSPNFLYQVVQKNILEEEQEEVLSDEEVLDVSDAEETETEKLKRIKFKIYDDSSYSVSKGGRVITKSKEGHSMVYGKKIRKNFKIKIIHEGSGSWYYK